MLKASLPHTGHKFWKHKIVYDNWFVSIIHFVQFNTFNIKGRVDMAELFRLFFRKFPYLTLPICQTDIVSVKVTLLGRADGWFESHEKLRNVQRPSFNGHADDMRQRPLDYIFIFRYPIFFLTHLSLMKITMLFFLWLILNVQLFAALCNLFMGKH